jgi:hypothetical protein
VLKDARLDFYKSEADLLAHADPINARPVRLTDSVLELDPRRFAQQVASLGGAMKSGLLGDNSRDFAMTDLLSSTSDLPYAAKHFRFALLPRAATELQVADSFEMLAPDESSYKEWTSTLAAVIGACEELAGVPTVVSTMQAGQTNVHQIVRAAATQV